MRVSGVASGGDARAEDDEVPGAATGAAMTNRPEDLCTVTTPAPLPSLAAVAAAAAATAAGDAVAPPLALLPETPFTVCVIGAVDAALQAPPPFIQQRPARSSNSCASKVLTSG
ncbi:hypothetical protein Vretifemale_19172 [Volvox reticuliferus]|nr:hypothetical protein Vretifemale_19172 [Volvox reticuliferus]